MCILFTTCAACQNIINVFTGQESSPNKKHVALNCNKNGLKKLVLDLQTCFPYELASFVGSV